ncbi:histidine kinase-like ATPase, C-terminal domain-containing protein [Artemisia annua]|uniref:Histidine kinase-like ATPase, C-terminal domain-containing protein n=1 Tax=Artemisia annua TaxID=35608 RepID=A0A2U1MV13_ARTAN|nr:histidine kinase-like ATPase, C-terminal domain-containing protein [Artemisia annua]
MEEVDADSPWNQWLLSEFPNVFLSAELSFCSLPCFRENPARGVSVFLSFVPLGEEVCGVFSSLPRKIISKLCVSNCLLLEGGCNEWVRPCKVVRNWTEQIRSLLPDSLIREHLDVGYLNKDVVLSDSLAQALGIEDCGPKFLVQVMISLLLVVLKEPMCNNTENYNPNFVKFRVSRNKMAAPEKGYDNNLKGKTDD